LWTQRAKTGEKRNFSSTFKQQILQNHLKNCPKAQLQKGNLHQLDFRGLNCTQKYNFKI